MVLYRSLVTPRCRASRVRKASRAACQTWGRRGSRPGYGVCGEPLLGGLYVRHNRRRHCFLHVATRNGNRTSHMGLKAPWAPPPHQPPPPRGTAERDRQNVTNARQSSTRRILTGCEGSITSESAMVPSGGPKLSANGRESKCVPRPTADRQPNRTRTSRAALQSPAVTAESHSSPRGPHLQIHPAKPSCVSRKPVKPLGPLAS